ncbi:MAG: hypothetical protein ACOYBR_09785 [Fluviibacter sp.]
MPGTGANAWPLCSVSGGGALPVECAPAFITIADATPNGGNGGQTVTRDIPIAGAELGMHGAIEIDARGDLAYDQKTVTVADVFGGGVLPPVYTNATGGAWVRVVSHFPVAVGDLGGGQFGLRLQITSTALVTSTSGMPSGWSWQIRVDGVLA